MRPSSFPETVSPHRPAVTLSCLLFLLFRSSLLYLPSFLLALLYSVSFLLPVPLFSFHRRINLSFSLDPCQCLFSIRLHIFLSACVLSSHLPYLSPHLIPSSLTFSVNRVSFSLLSVFALLLLCLCVILSCFLTFIIFLLPLFLPLSPPLVIIASCSPLPPPPPPPISVLQFFIVTSYSPYPPKVCGWEGALHSTILCLYVE